ncbi:MAG: DUF364 domain-containing protein [Rubrivivax sp.]
MNVAQEVVAQLGQAFAGRAVPRVAALHLPPVPWDGSKDGEFGAVELASGALGLSYLLLDDTLRSVGAAAAAVQGADALALAARWADPASTPAQRALGFAAVNALTRELFDRAGFVPPPATDSIGGIDPQPAESIGMVGYFPPLVKQVTARGARLTVLELRQDLAGTHEGFRITLDARDLAGCTQVLSTSTVLLNHTLDDVLAACRAASRFVLIGPGAGCLPDALFARGVTALGGTWIRDAAAFRDAIASGGKWSAAAGKCLLQASAYPGLVALAAASR